MKSLLSLVIVLCAGAALATPATNGSSQGQSTDLLVKFSDAVSANRYALKVRTGGARIENLGGGNWMRVQFNNQQFRSQNIRQLRADPNVLTVQPNYKVRLMNDYRTNDTAVRAQLEKLVASGMKRGILAPDNPAIPARTPSGAGADPQFSKQWGMIDIGAQNAWKSARGRDTVVAVIDTGVDYTHPDLIENLWRNAGETGMDSQGRDKTANGIDDDGNGFVDDVIGWDFASNDNKPYDLSVEPIDLLMGGGNPGHGTHCAGNVAARGANGIGISGVAPEAKIMVLRFLTEKGEGTTAEAVKSINYAVKMGAKVLSNSWGSEGEDPSEGAQNQALRDAITEAQNAGSLFIAAAGNGHQGVGYDNDTDGKPAYPASYDHDIIISVAALDSKDALGSFSNWGARTVDIGAPGVVVFSTTVTGKYSDTVIDMFGIKATWDGTSMAAPHVAGAAALYWSKNPGATWREVKEALLRSAKPINALKGKAVSGAKLNIDSLLLQ